MQKQLMKTSIFLFTMMAFLFGKSAEPLKVGDIAPDFTLLSEENKKVTLKDYRGKRVVVYFFPKADTPG